MIILHGGLIGGYFLLWGEESLPAEAGATVLVAGSAVFGSHDPGQAVKDLRSASEVLK